MSSLSGCDIIHFFTDNNQPHFNYRHPPASLYSQASTRLTLITGIHQPHFSYLLRHARRKHRGFSVPLHEDSRRYMHRDKQVGLARE